MYINLHLQEKCHYTINCITIKSITKKQFDKFKIKRYYKKVL